MQLSKDKKFSGFYMAMLNVIGASKRFFEIKYSKYQRYLLLQRIVIYTNSYYRVFTSFR